MRIPGKITKLPSLQTKLGNHRPASLTPFKWRFAGWPMMAHLKCYLDPLSLHQLKNCQSLALFDNIFWIRACIPLGEPVAIILEFMVQHITSMKGSQLKTFSNSQSTVGILTLNWKDMRGSRKFCQRGSG